METILIPTSREELHILLMEKNKLPSSNVYDSISLKQQPIRIPVPRACTSHTNQFWDAIWEIVNNANICGIGIWHLVFLLHFFFAGQDFKIYITFIIFKNTLIYMYIYVIFKFLIFRSSV